MVPEEEVVIFTNRVIQILYVYISRIFGIYPVGEEVAVHWTHQISLGIFSGSGLDHVLITR